MVESKNSILTRGFRIRLAELCAGVRDTLPPVRMLVLGDGGVDADGDPLTPHPAQELLLHEVCRYPVEASLPEAGVARFVAHIPEEEQEGIKLSEMALVDADGDFCAIKNFRVKHKDGDAMLSITFDLEF